MPPVRGIVHAACPPQGGANEEGVTLEETQQRFLEAKVGILSLPLFISLSLSLSSLSLLIRLRQLWLGIPRRRVGCLST